MLADKAEHNANLEARYRWMDVQVSSSVGLEWHFMDKGDTMGLVARGILRCPDQSEDQDHGKQTPFGLSARFGGGSAYGEVQSVEVFPDRGQSDCSEVAVEGGVLGTSTHCVQLRAALGAGRPQLLVAHQSKTIRGLVRRLGDREREKWNEASSRITITLAKSD